jgi:hypothetical protein
MRPTARRPHLPTHHGARAAARRALGRRAAAVALGALLVGAPDAAHAQFGGLVKRAARAAADAAGGGAAGAAAGRAGLPAGSAGRAGDASRLEITPERVDAFLAAMRGPVEGVRRRQAGEAARQAYEAQLADYQAKDDAYDSCKDRLTDGAVPDVRNPELQRAARRFGEANGPLTARAVKAREAGDERLAKQLTDSIQTLILAVDEASFPTLRAKCGAPPREPRKPASQDDGSGPAYRATVPEGMTPVQFGTLRERIGAWLVADGAGGGLSDAERRVLESRRAALEGTRPYYQQGGWANVLAGLEDGR